jgi:hypothetical protein
MAIAFASLDPVKDAINAAVVPDANDDDQADADDGGSKKQSDLLVQLAASAQLFHDGDNNAYADIAINGHRETWPVKSSGFKSWLTREYYRQTKSAPNPAAMNTALAVITAKACFDGEQREVYLRIAGHDERIYLDLADPGWTVVEIDTDGWRVVNDPPVRFIRRKGMRSLPLPAPGGSIDTLRRYVNVRDGSDFLLLVAWLVAALRERGPYPVINVTGEAGSAKSTLLTILRNLIDPNEAGVRAPPRDERDLFITANNSYLLPYDNLSWLPDWLSDGLSRIATEGSFATRALYTDDEERLFTAMRPILLGAVDSVVVKGDLADRIIALQLAVITGKKRRRKQDVLDEFERDRPLILGALLDAVSHGLRRLPETHLEELPRMADFAVWATACGDGLLWEKGEFAEAYAANRSKVNENVVEGDALTAAVHTLVVAHEGEWSGTMTELLERLNVIAGVGERNPKKWP